MEKIYHCECCHDEALVAYLTDKGRFLCHCCSWWMDFDIIDEVLIESPRSDDMENLMLGHRPIVKDLRPKWTVWNKVTVHKDVKSRARRSRRVFKQYLKTGSLRLLKAAEKKITRWDFD